MDFVSIDMSIIMRTQGFQSRVYTVAEKSRRPHFCVATIVGNLPKRIEQKFILRQYWSDEIRGTATYSE